MKTKIGQVRNKDLREEAEARGFQNGFAEKT